MLPVGRQAYGELSLWVHGSGLYLYSHHHMALFISLARSLTVIPVMYIIAHTAPQLLWYSYLIAYTSEALIIFTLHRALKLKFVLKT